MLAGWRVDSIVVLSVSVSLSIGSFHLRQSVAMPVN
jgi:hypothetical protein